MLWPEIKVIISGGGTGGHIFPAISIANALMELNSRNKILFVGAQGRMEMEKVPAAGYEIIGLKIKGIRRKLSLENFKLPFLLISSLFKSAKVIKRFSPDVAVGVGGYASGPLLFMAGLKNVPSLIQEQNSYAGITNRLLAKRASKICVAYDGMNKYFPQEKIVLTGNPVRKQIREMSMDKASARASFGLDPDRKTLLVIGGSLGAASINKSVLAGLNKLSEKGIQLIWQTGKSGAYFIDKAGNPNEIKRHISPFIERMDLAFAASDFIISRAGAGSISELQIAGKPVILVPSPNVAEDHQTKNAMALVEMNAALLVKDSEAEMVLIDKAISVSESEALCRSLSENIKSLAIFDSDLRIAKEVYRLAGVIEGSVSKN
ncbi:MAG: undecaprenyldiphospho-muramoylpentapeptide beta-N-acetylglucosaminyltransferase [Bacteroidetes bacterium]|nr:MAG: undecaprenyldiphospho-muramoylpentapeptide beta-N-acetylglucosaminyltransferase [Bacteroidota bacterium]REK03491.1 MAG: undecaprenyldiphospho-muramoylpentapeptide beta-N-acetylglucosaminyltransferase [Bacteroidota bacterium]REK34796.1 MAG: undecaprenyldiphospho-muramoylpentapeptide beta-N-acetylglucosaminyltransferase [Bacteroidota bacterium]REK51325.1 MAG: undecaprenyldiphospho-muramoylpentapeptide beta-N-acetylglucosaminyltransferase [Bacteroidota bacterium]